MTARDEAERAIAEVLAGHTPRTVWEPSNYNDPTSGHPIGVACSCGWGVEGGNSDEIHRAHVASVLADLMADGLAKAWETGHGTTCDGIHEKTWSLDGCEQYNPYRKADQ